MSRLLVIEDAPDTVKWLRERLRVVWGDDSVIDIAPTLRLARERLALADYEIVIVDLSLPDV
jgi:DNA-binding response OmpR family regulator